ncbi:phosphatase PAP2 family protein [Halalkalibacillus halophilus]|uniref:phosphatase PAP2 family protein n=1 Tax=Halalkalibacillus halophilus TaxID=392827 RepID=UPI000400CDFA|nr:phosphatase PAP2 family protein [Halalkalibacillus halophilus]
MEFKESFRKIPTSVYVSIFIALSVVAICFYFFIELADEVLEEERIIIDGFASQFVQLIERPILDSIFGVVTHLGSVTTLVIGSILLVIAIIVYYGRRWWRIIYFAIAMIGISILTHTLKIAFSRERPNIVEQYDGTGFSFPSGHSTAPMVFYGFIIYLVLRSYVNKALKWTLIGFLSLLIMSIGFSRVYLGVHYISDVIAGFTLGLSWLITCILVLEFTLYRRGKKL